MYVYVIFFSFSLCKQFFYRKHQWILVANTTSSRCIGDVIFFSIALVRAVLRVLRMNTFLEYPRDPRGFHHNWEKPGLIVFTEYLYKHFLNTR